MALKNGSRTAQWPLVASFSFAAGDTMKDVDGVTRTFGAMEAQSFAIIALPPNSVVMNAWWDFGAATGPTAVNVSVYIDNVSTFVSDDMVAGVAGQLADPAIGPISNPTGGNVLLDIECTVNPATVLPGTIWVEYTVLGRSNEVQIV